MRRVLAATAMFASSALAACQSDQTDRGYRNPLVHNGQPYGAPCGYHAVDNGVCPHVGYRVPAGVFY